MADARGDRLRLVADCASCAGLCCVALPFAASADFAIDKPAGTPCPHLATPGFACTIHDRLRDNGFPGCAAYDCFGAGQHVTQHTFAGRSWREAPGSAELMFAAFRVTRQLHEMLWYLEEAGTLEPSGALHAELRQVLEDTERLTRSPAAELAGLDVAAHRERVGPLLRRASAAARAGSGRRGKDFRRADLVGTALPGADLRGADLSGALLVAADLSGADLRRADLLGADLRDTDLAGADLRGALYLTRSQIGGARGDGATRLPAELAAPTHWQGRATAQTRRPR